MLNLMDVTRVEVTNHTVEMGRQYVAHGPFTLELSLQDDGRTLKLVITERKGQT
jgi:hypothetical protein